MSNIPSFAEALAAIPKRKSAMLIASENDPALFIGRVSKKGNGRFEFVVFDCPLASADTVADKKPTIIFTGTAGTTNRATAEARKAFGQHFVEPDAKED